MENNYLTGRQKNELSQYKEACQKKGGSACQRAKGLELLDKLQDEILFQACAYGTKEECNLASSSDPAAKARLYELGFFSKVALSRVVDKAPENGVKALAGLGEAIKTTEIKPLVDAKGSIQGWLVDVGQGGVLGGVAYAATEIILPTTALELLPLVGKGTKVVVQGSERILVRESGEILGKISAAEADSLVKSGAVKVESSVSAKTTSSQTESWKKFLKTEENIVNES